MIICMQCGSQNKKGDKRCASCGAVLPHFDTTPTVKVETVTGRFKLFCDNVESVRAGVLSLEAFYEFLQAQYAILSEKRAEIEGLVQESNYAEQSAQEVDVGFQGMENFELGIQEMSLYCEDENPEHLEAGLDLIRIGNDMVNDAKRINRQDRKKLEEEWGWM